MSYSHLTRDRLVLLAKWLGIGVGLYLFIVGIGGMGESFKLFGKGFSAQKLAARNPRMAALAEELIRKHEHKLREHYAYVRAMSIDPPEILNWRWEPQRQYSTRTTQKVG